MRLRKNNVIKIPKKDELIQAPHLFSLEQTVVVTRRRRQEKSTDLGDSAYKL